MTGNALKDLYGSILWVNNGTTGLTTSLQAVKDGAGNVSCIYLSDDQVRIIPENDNTTALLDVQNQAGDTLFLVDSSNTAVKAHGEHLNTNFVTWALHDVSPTAGTHYPIPVGGRGLDSSSSAWGMPTGFGTGTDPATSLTISTTSHDYLACYWKVPNNIEIETIEVMSSANAASTHTYHVYSYTLTTGSGSTAGDLASGTLIATLEDLTVGVDRISTGTLTVSSSSVTAGKILIAFIETSDTDDASLSMTMRYHLV